MYISPTQLSEKKFVQFIPFAGVRYEAAMRDRVGLYEKRGGTCWSPDPTIDHHSTNITHPIFFAYVPEETDYDAPSWIMVNPDLFEVKYFVGIQEVERSQLYWMNSTLRLMEQDAQREIAWLCRNGWKPGLQAEDEAFDVWLNSGEKADIKVRITSK